MVLAETGRIVASDNETTVTLSLATFVPFPTFMFLPTKFSHLIPNNLEDYTSIFGTKF